MKKKLARQYCPHCHDSLDEVDDSVMTEMGVDPSRPFQKGDLGICQRCGTVLEFDDNLVLKVAPQRRLVRFTDTEREAYERINVKRRQYWHLVN
jgi:transcription initiation factor IIE alpha subunit